MVKLGRSTHGRPISSRMRSASGRLRATALRGTSTPIFCTASLNFCRSSALSITAASAPISSTPCFFSTPCLCRSIAVFSPVWPPSVGSRASGRSFSMIFSTTCQVIGSMYVRSAVSESVMMVAGLLFTSTTR